MVSKEVLHCSHEVAGSYLNESDIFLFSDRRLKPARNNLATN